VVSAHTPADREQVDELEAEATLGSRASGGDDAGDVSEHTGRGPTQARTTIDGETVVVSLQDGMTKAARSLADVAAEIFLLDRKVGAATA
jgi:hypothetical protein